MNLYPNLRWGFDKVFRNKLLAFEIIDNNILLFSKYINPIYCNFVIIHILHNMGDSLLLYRLNCGSVHIKSIKFFHNINKLAVIHEDEEEEKGGIIIYNFFMKDKEVTIEEVYRLDGWGLSIDFDGKSLCVFNYESITNITTHRVEKIELADFFLPDSNFYNSDYDRDVDDSLVPDYPISYKNGNIFYIMYRDFIAIYDKDGRFIKYIVSIEFFDSGYVTMINNLYISFLENKIILGIMSKFDIGYRNRIDTDTFYLDRHLLPEYEHSFDELIVIPEKRLFIAVRYNHPPFASVLTKEYVNADVSIMDESHNPICERMNFRYYENIIVSKELFCIEQGTTSIYQIPSKCKHCGEYGYRKLGGCVHWDMWSETILLSHSKNPEDISICNINSDCMKRIFTFVSEMVKPCKKAEYCKF